MKIDYYVLDGTVMEKNLFDKHNAARLIADQVKVGEFRVQLSLHNIEVIGNVCSAFGGITLLSGDEQFGLSVFSFNPYRQEKALYLVEELRQAMENYACRLPTPNHWIFTGLVEDISLSKEEINILHDEILMVYVALLQKILRTKFGSSKGKRL